MKHDGDGFERALRRSARDEPVGPEQAPLVETAERLKSLSATPPPPHGLVAGRQRFLETAARLREGAIASRRRPAWALRLAAAAAALLVLSGALLGATRVSASSLPGDPLYGVKRAAESVRLALTVVPESRSALLGRMAEERLGEILLLLEQGRTVDDPVAGEASRELRQALEAAARLEDAPAALALQKLGEAIRQREAAIRQAAGEPPDPHLQALLREMERVRQEALLGQGDPAGLREWLRKGLRPESTEWPGATPTPRPSSTGALPEPFESVAPGTSATPHRTGMPATSPEPSSTPHETPATSATPHSTGGPHTTNTPQASATPQRTGEPPGSQTPGATVTPQPPRATPTPGQGGTAAPTAQPGGGGGNKP